MDTAVKDDHKLASQWLRLSFHDAGTFNRAVPEGGANGCIMTDPEMRNQPENANLDIAIETLKTIRDNWEQLKSTCINVSNADIIQFAGFFAAVRQTGDVPGITSSKLTQLSSFKWGRPDATSCNIGWTANLPGFSLGTNPANLARRCKVAGQQIKTKMMDRNGFTAEEATVLIGAHTIGLTRNTFGSGLAAPWVENGADDATPTGPVFDNAFFTFMTDDITAKTTTAFANNRSPFTEIFPDWVRRESFPPLNFLDTDLALAFPPASSSDHPNYHISTVAFSNNNQLFLDTFHRALSKMGKLGVSVTLSAPSSCSTCAAFEDPISPDELVKLASDLRNAIATADSSLAVTQIATKEKRVAQTTAVTMV
jgi:catalase (peroxidase I)